MKILYHVVHLNGIPVLVDLRTQKAIGDTHDIVRSLEESVDPNNLSEKHYLARFPESEKDFFTNYSSLSESQRALISNYVKTMATENKSQTSQSQNS